MLAKIITCQDHQRNLQSDILKLVNKQKGLAPILIIILIALAVGGGYLIYTNYLKERVLTNEEVEKQIANCKIYSVGRSHKDLERGYWSIQLRDVSGREGRFKINKNDPQINKKIGELIISPGKCPRVLYWME